MFPQIFGKYVLERELASGGMAVVYLATLRGAGGFEKRLVVKQIRAELASDGAFVERLVAEAKTTVGLSHPNIVPVYELGVEQGVYFIAMELAQGVTLADLLQTNGRLSAEEGAYLGVEICRALDYAHRKAGIVHRDATPRNVLVDDEGAVRLIDFGIATPVTVDGAARERVFGSPGHMPIEQLRGGRLTPATDVFAVGALLIETWTGKPPFRRETREESDLALTLLPPAPSSVDPKLEPLDELVLRAVAYDASARPQTAEELARPLREFLRSADLGDLSRRLGERVRKTRRASVPKTSLDGGARTPMISASASRSGSIPPAQTSVTRPIAQSVNTETFAARDEVVEWARRASDHPLSSPDLTDPLELLDIPLPPGTPRAPGAPSAPLSIDTSSVEEVPRRRGPLVATLIAAGVLGAAALFATVGPSKSGADGAPASKGGAPASATGVEPTSLPAVTPSAGSAAPVPSAPDRPLPAHTAALAGSAPPASSAEGEAKTATLTITADLAARVTVDGSSYGVTPIRGLKRSAGRHVVTLVSVELDERLSTTVDAKPGQALAIHAEFTRPVPALRVH